MSFEMFMLIKLIESVWLKVLLLHTSNFSAKFTNDSLIPAIQNVC